MMYNREEIREKYKDLFKYSLDLIYVHDMKGNFLDANDITLMALGYEMEELPNISFINLLDKEQLLEAIRITNEIKMAGKQSKRSEYKLKTKDGDTIYIETYGIPIKKNGKIYAILGIGTNITERKLAEQQLKESEKKFRQIFESIPDFFFLVLEDSTIIEYRGKEEGLYISPETFLGKKLTEVIPPDLGKITFESISRTNLTKQPQILEYRLPIKEKIRDYEARFLPFSNNQVAIFIRDITESKKAQQKLKESEENYRLLSENANDLIALLNNKYEYEYINDKILRDLLGYLKEDMIGKSPTEFIHPDDLEKAFESMKKCRETGECREELRFKKKDGSYIWLDNKGNIFINDKGERKVLLISRDITDKKEAEQKLKYSEKRYRDLADLLPDVIMEADLELNLIYANSVASEKFGYNREDFRRGLKLFQFVDPEDKEKLSLYLSHISKGEKIKPQEFRLRKKDGSYFHARVNTSPILKEGRVVGFRSALYDITKIVLAEKKLKESEKKYHKLFEETPFAIIILNSDGVIIDCNPTTTKLFGYKKEELIGRDYRNLSIIHSKYLSMLDLLIKKLFEGGKLHSINIELYKKDNKLVWVEFQASLVKFGEKAFVQLIMHDITERKRAEFLNNEQINKLKELDLIRKNLIIRVSHELKTPLIPICNGAELLLTQYNSELGSEIKEIIELIEKGGERLKILVEKLLDMSRLAYSKLKLEKKRTNLSEIIRECVKDMKYTIKKRVIIFNLELPDTLYLDIDGIRIEQVITNLLSNAIKNTPPKGKITINLQKEKDNYAIITVSDTGVGFTEKEMELIWKRFGKLERYGEGLEYIDIQGSGLGLFISKDIIELHGGDIWAESPGRNKGSTFIVKLPLK